jgi:hypothetical protein
MPIAGEDYQRWSTVAANNGDIDPLIDWQEGQARRTVNNSSRSELAAHAKNRVLNNGSIITTGTANAQAFLSGVTYDAIPINLRCMLKVGSGLTNTGPMTLNMDGLGNIEVKTETGNGFVGGEFVENRFVNLLYNGTNWIFLFSVLNNVELTGNSTAETPSDPLDNDNSIATTEWVQNLIYGGAGIILNQRVFNTPGNYTFTPTVGMKSCLVECFGSGGGGGSAFSDQDPYQFGGGGGGGGGYTRRFLTAAQIGASQPLVVGVGGGGGAPGSNGGNGNPTYMGVLGSELVRANGGSGGTFSSSAPVAASTGGAGGAAWSGPANIVSVVGSPGLGGAFDLDVTVGEQPILMGSTGGVGPLGGGGGGTSPNTNGSNGGNYGGGGGGGTSYGAQTSWSLGGAGGPGAIVITEFAGAGQPGPQGSTGPQGPQGLPGGTFADAPSNGSLYGRINGTWNVAQPLDADLTALAGASGTNTIYYRSAVDTWSAVTISAPLSFSGGSLSSALFSNIAQGDVPASGGGTTSYLRADGTWAVPPGSGGTITIGTTPITGGSSGNYLYNNAAVFGEKTPTQLTADLNIFTSTLKGLAPASGGGTTNFLRADGTWAAPAGGGGGNVIISGTPTANQWAQWTDATHIQGVDVSGTPWVLKAGDTMIGSLLVSTSNPAIELRKTAATQFNQIFGRNGTSARWSIYLGESTAETGGNSGSDFQLNSYNDAGTLLATPLKFLRSSGLGTVAGDPTAALGIATKQYVDNFPTFTSSAKGFAPSSGGGTTNYLRADGTWAAPSGGPAVPTYQVFTSGSGTYTTPANCRQIEATLVGGGAGGGGGSGGGLGTAGGNTTFGPSFVANGSAASVAYYQSGAPGTATGGTQNITGGAGQDGPVGSASITGAGGQGGASSRGGNGGGGNARAGSNAGANTGSGGGGGGVPSGGAAGGCGGSAGGTCIGIINSPAATYSWAVGVGGGGGAGAAGGSNGGNGAAGIIIVKEIY